MITIYKVKYPHPGQPPSFSQVLQAAYKAVDDTIMLEPVARQIKAVYDSTWVNGPDCLLTRSNIRPVRFARQMAYHYLMTTEGNCKRIGKKFGFDYTTVLYGRNVINDVISCKFDSIHKDAYELFKKYLTVDVWV